MADLFSFLWSQSLMRFFLDCFFVFLLTKTKADQATWFTDWLPLFVLGFCYFPFRQQSICAISLAPVLLLRLEPSFFFETHLRTNFFTIIKLLIGTQKYCPSWELDLLVGLRADTLFLFCCYWYQMLNNRIPKKEPRIRECQVNASFLRISRRKKFKKICAKSLHKFFLKKRKHRGGER